MEIFNFIKHLHQICLEQSKYIKYDNKNRGHVFLLMLYGSLIELTSGLIALISYKNKTAIPSIFRSIFEAYIELINLYKDDTYIKNMIAGYHSQWLKVLREAKDNPNRFLEGIKKDENLSKRIQEREEEFNDLANQGYKPLDVFERFNRAGMNEEYRSLYNFLCADVHSNMRALIERHLEIHENNFSVIYNKDIFMNDIFPYLLHTMKLLIDASQKIHKYFKTESIERMEKLECELNELSVKWKIEYSS